MAMLGRYERTTALSNKDAGSCRWCFAIRGGQEYFIKEFLEPKYPENDTTSSPEKRAKKIKKCEAFEQSKTRIYRAINEHSDGNAVRVVDFFRVGAKYYMVMPKINPVKMSVEEIARLPEHVKRRICTVIAHSVAQLHKSKFVHADIKHTNIMLVHSRTSKLTAKLIDYDAGFFEYDPPTHPEEIPGDQVYFSPEAWTAILGEEAQLTCKLDIFALGILFHQYLTGKLPGYDEEKFSCAGEAVAAGEKLNISWDMPADIHRVISQMLAANPCERPSAQEVFNNLTKQDKLSYTVHHEVEGKTRDSFTFELSEENYGNRKIAIKQESLKPREYTGYKYDRREPWIIEGETVDDGTVITVKYVKDLNQQKTVSYTVQHKVGGKIVEQTVHTTKVWINATNEIPIVKGSLEPKSYAGCTFEAISTDKQDGDRVPNGTIITLKYTEAIIENDVIQNEGEFIGDAPARPGFWDLGDL
ncbi:MAG: hypothetical protein E7445_04070 [Ruminococcaceae bacterium]|nr:hypothetical protein [Oscillospiraceae bacterium]